MAVDPNSITDYLRQRKRPATFSARRNLWVSLFPNTYSGTAAQNTQLLAELRRIDSLTALKPIGQLSVAPGDELFCRATGSDPLSIRNTLTGTVQSVPPGKVPLGTITQPGVYPFIVDDGVNFSSLTVLARSVGGQLELARVSSSGEWRSPPPAVVEVPGLNDRFLETMREFLLENGIGWKILAQTLEEKSLPLLMDGLLISTGFIPGLQGHAVQVGSQAGLDLFAGWMEKIIAELANHGYSQAERDHLTLIWVLIPTLAKIAIGAIGFKHSDPGICRFVETMSLSVDVVSASHKFNFHDKDLQVAVGLIWDATTKTVAQVCEIKPVSKH